MSETYYPSEEKHSRAKSAVDNYEKLVKDHPSRADVKLVGLGRAEKLEGDELVNYVYNGLGGSPVLSGAPAKEAKARATEAKQKTAKRRDVALRREKINVK